MSVEKYVIMPNHVHLLIIIEDEVNGGASRMPRPTEKRIPRFISSMKRYTNKISKYALWQDGYYDHVIRDENDFLAHWKYIDDNPAKWAQDKYYIG
jgi:REP element-mobilizing transposase RayT